MSYVSTHVHVAADMDFDVETPGDAEPREYVVKLLTGADADGMIFLHFPPDGVDLDRFAAKITAARPPQPGPPREPSATSHPQGFRYRPEDPS